MTYSEVAEDLPLQLAILHRQVWIAICGKQSGLALDVASRIQNLIEHPATPIPPRILSLAYVGVSRGLAFNLRKQEAEAALFQVYDAFASTYTDDADFIYVEYNGPSLNEGRVRYYLGQYDKSFDAIARVVDLKTLTLKQPISSERARVQAINEMTLAALKRPNWQR